VRTLDGVRSITPRRACCRHCETTHVLLAWAVPRRRDSAEVIGKALLDNARGLGHRRIAARLERPPGDDPRVAAQRSPPAQSRSAPAPGAGRERSTRASWISSVRPAHRRSTPSTRSTGWRASVGCSYGLSASPWELTVTLTGLLYGRAHATRPGFERRCVRASGSHRSPGSARPYQHVSRVTTALRGERSQRKRSGLNARRTALRPRPGRLHRKPFPPPPPPFGPGVEMGVARAGDGSRSERRSTDRCRCGAWARVVRSRGGWRGLA
jgi:hypothetical protein